MSAPHRPARIGFLLAQLGAHAAEVFAEQVRPLGVTPSQAGVIRILGHRPGITQRELADKLGAAPSRVVALIDQLDGKGLARRARGTTDRRVQRLELTDEGRTLLGKLRRAAESQESTVTAGLTPRQRDDLYRLLTIVSAHRGLDGDVHPGFRGTGD